MAELELPILDPRVEQEIVEQALVRVFNASAGTVNDFSSSSVARVLIEGLSFAASELLYYVNRLPLSLVLQFLRVSGVERRLGTAAIANITFTLTQALATPFTVPQGFQVSDASGKYVFTTDALLTLPAGATSGVVSATAAALGTAYNLPAFTIDRFSQPLTFLSTAINLEPATGGGNEESVDDAIARGLDAIRRRNLVTADDYEEDAIAILGEGAVAKAIGLLSADKITYQLGAVHLFLLNQDGNAPSTAQLSSVQSLLFGRVQIGTSLYVSAIDLVDVDGDLVAKLLPGEDPEDVAELLWQAYQDYLSPTKFEVGASVILKEVEYALRLAGGIEYIQALTLNGLATNLAIANQYSLPKAHSLFVELVDSAGNSFPVLKGAGEVYV